MAESSLAPVGVGAQPDESELRQLAREGVASVINVVRDEDESELALSPRDEGVLVRELGLDYWCLLSFPGADAAHEVSNFRFKLDMLPKPIFVHSRTGERAASFVAGAAAQERGWSSDRAREEVRRLGFEVGDEAERVLGCLTDEDDD